MGKTGLVYHPHFLEHDTGQYHPESPERLRAIFEGLKSSAQWDHLHHLNLPEKPRKDLIHWIERAHRPSHIHHLESNQPIQGLRSLDMDTPMSPQS